MEEDASEAPAQQTTKSKSLKELVEIIELNSPSKERNPTFKRLRKKIKETKDENKKLKKENLQARIKLKENIDLCEEAIAKEKQMVKRSLPLHRQVKNVYMKKSYFQAVSRKQIVMYRKVRNESCRCVANLLKVKHFATNLL